MGSSDARVHVDDIIQNVYDPTNEALRINPINGLKYEEVTVASVDYYIIELAVSGTKLFAIRKSDRTICSIGEIETGRTDLA